MTTNAASTPPTCPICGAAHWMRDPHVFKGSITDAKLAAYRAAVAKAALASAEKPKRGRPSTGFDKKAHDRQKARERRAAKKAAMSGRAKGD